MLESSGFEAKGLPACAGANLYGAKGHLAIVLAAPARSLCVYRFDTTLAEDERR
jgi:hypothetical protein